MAEHLCLVAAGLPPEDPRARARFQPFLSRDAHVLRQLRRALDAATAAAAATPTRAAVAPCRGRLSLVLRHVLEV